MEKLNSSNITIRPFNLSDVDGMMSYAGDDRVTAHLRWNTLTSRDEALTFIKDVCIPHPWRRSICLASDDRSVGFLTVFPWSGEDRCKADIGYGVAPEYWGQGVATSALTLAIPEVFKDFPEVVRLQAFVFVENKASQRVLEKVGFQKEGLLRKYCYVKGLLRDLFLYSFLSTDLMPSVMNC